MNEELKEFFEENNTNTENVDDIWKGDEIPLDEWNNQENTNQEPTNTENKNQLKPLIVGSKTIEIKDIDELYALARRGLEVEEKYNQLSNYQDIIDIAKEIGKDKLLLFKDAINGNVGSKKEILKLLGEESIELEFEEPRQEEKQEENPIQKMFDNVAKRDPELSGRIIKTINTIDPSLRQVILSIPKAFEVFIKQVEDGSFNKIYPVALKIKAKEPHIDWGDAFKKAINELKNNKDVPKTPSEPLQEEHKKSLHTEKKDDYDSIWNSDVSDPDEIEKLLIEEI